MSAPISSFLRAAYIRQWGSTDMPLGPLGPPNLHSDLPLYPIHEQVLRVLSATVPGPAGVAQTAGSSVLAGVYHLCYVQQRRDPSGLLRDREPALAQNCNDGTLSAGFYTGRLCGNFGGLPVYVVTERSIGAQGPAGSAAASSTFTLKAAAYTLNATTSIPDSTWTLIDKTNLTISYQTDNIINNAGSFDHFQAPAALSGWWSLSGRCVWASNSTGHRKLACYTGAGANLECLDSRAALGSSQVTSNLVAFDFPSASGAFGFYVWQNSGGNLNILHTAASGDPITRLTARFVPQTF